MLPVSSHVAFMSFIFCPNCIVILINDRALEEKRARLGLLECVNHDLLQPYPVLHEKPGDCVAHIKFTVLLMPNGSDRITSHPLQDLQPSKTIDDPEIKAWLALGTKTKKKGGGKKKKGKKGDKAEESTEAEPMDESRE
ncbi:hypothetical protein RHGRI_015514 [Rhododendron griersonianum]|uniref:Uncharacterized protein n=1 Tax=Rhododendron griersonianum TaxID=479676 RepID=A0AAV6KDL8_9ERIC|nr:hypothetical protein RHGRI_015514 [Rhododendron griersonianum]